MAESRIINTETYQGVYPTVFKKIDSTDVMINPFQVYKSWTVYSASATSSALPLNGIYTDINNLPALGSGLTYNDLMNVDGTLQSITYYSINHLYYKYKDQPSKTYGPTNLARTKKALYQSASILAFPQLKIGEGIKAASFALTTTGYSLASDMYSNVYDTAFNTGLIVGEETLYEGFNEYFDTSRIKYTYQNVTYVPGVKTSTGATSSIGYAAKFTGSGYIDIPIEGYYDRDHDYSVSLFISSSAFGSGSNQLIIAKASGSSQSQYPFRIELSGSNNVIFSAAGSTSFKTQITSSALSAGWNHIVCQKSGSSLKMHVNGILNSSITNSLLINTMSPFTASSRIDNTSTVKIGGYDSQSSNLSAVLDEIRVFNKSLTNANISALSDRSEGGTLLQTANVGNVFSKQGVVVISSPDYRYSGIMSSAYTASYRSTVTIHELSTIARLSAGDFNMSTNLTLTQDDDQTYFPFVSGSDFAPYITTIGLYNNAGQLVAIGKLAQPIKKRNDVDMNFLIRIDLDKDIAFKG
jgi:hypothetical protein